MERLDQKAKSSKKEINKKKHNLSPSSFQILFWRIAGSEISILERCTTDWNKHVGIGMAIFMTTLLAFFSGTYAAYFFTENILASLLFGVLWAALIYSIDRSLVVTLKKTPTKKWYDYILPFLLRGTLALVIAFVISIPLELLIFEENIEIHMTNYKQKQVGKTIVLESQNQSTEGKNKIRENDSIEYAKACAKLKLSEPDTKDYDNFKIEKKRISVKLENDYSRKTRNALIKKNQLSVYDPNYQTHNNIYKRYLAAEKNFQKDSLSPLVTEMAKYKKNWFMDMSRDSIKYKKKLESINEIIESDIIERDSIGNYQDSLLRNKKGFVLRFMILEDLATWKDNAGKNDSTQTEINSNKDNPEAFTIWLLLWLIRVIFILVELLPTIVKTATPLGSYDLALWSEEQNFANSLTDGEQEYLEHQSKLRKLEQATMEKQAKDRNAIQEELNRTLLKEIAEAQDAVARQKINEYKAKYLKK